MADALIHCSVAYSNRLASLGELTASLAHEINNPLACVIGNLEYVTSELVELSSQLRSARLEEIESAINEARTAADRVRHVVRDISLFARVDQHSQPLDVTQALALALNMFSAQIRQNCTLREEYAPTPQIEADMASLAQVFVNLLMNAAQALDEEGKAENVISVRAGTDVRGSAWIEIEDSGCGVAEDDLAKIFDEGFTTKPCGLGSGLPACREIVEALGGAINFRSVLDRGTIVRVTVPAYHAAEEVGNGEAREVRGRVLVIDDEPMLLRLFCRALSRDHDVITQQSAESALALVAEGQVFDAIICDLMMPGMNGMDFYRELEKIAPGQAERMVLVTGGAFSARARRFLDEKPIPCFQKPVDVNKLCDLIQRRTDKAGRWKRRFMSDMDKFLARVD